MSTANRRQRLKREEYILAKSHEVLKDYAAWRKQLDEWLRKA